jgi:hypothetical protein
MKVVLMVALHGAASLLLNLNWKNHRSRFYSRHYHDNPHYHRAMILPEYEDLTRYTAPPDEPEEIPHLEPEDYLDHEENEPE